MIAEDYRRILDIAIEQCKTGGCTGCAYYNNAEWEEPCRRCARNCKDYWRAGEQELHVPSAYTN